MGVAFLKPRAGGILVPLTFVVIAVPTVQAEELSYTASTTLFTDLTRTERGSRSDTRGGVGVSGDLGARMTTGAHELNALYGGTLETERSSLATGDRDNLSVRGSSRYNFYDPGSRFDFNAGHTIRSARNNTGFTLDPAAYDTQNAVNAGAGVYLYPGELTTLRVGGQAAKTWAENDLQEGESSSVDANLMRQVSERSIVSVMGRRAWEHKRERGITLDSVSLGLNTQLENGSFSASAGVSRAESDDIDNEAVVGSVARHWQTALNSTRVSYERSQSSTLLDLALEPIPELGKALEPSPELGKALEPSPELGKALEPSPELGIEDEFSVRVQGLTVSDTVMLVHSTQRLCGLCSVNFVVRGTKKEYVSTGNEIWEYTGGAGVGLAVTDVKTVDLDYRWQGDALEERSSIDDQVHRFTVTYRHHLTDMASWGAAFDTAFTRGQTDQDRYQARLFFTFGWDGMERAW